jgi:hypothetical protein
MGKKDPLNPNARPHICRPVRHPSEKIKRCAVCGKPM